MKTDTVKGGDLTASVRYVIRGGGVAQSVEHRTGTPPTQIRLRQGIFLPESTFSADSLTMSVHPLVQLHALTSVRTLKIP